MKEMFRELAEGAAHAVGSYCAFLLALVTIVVWASIGLYFKYSDTWQLVINTGTTVITFLIVFLIQNTQNRETRIVALKLDELLRAVAGARTGMVSLDHMSDEELEVVRQEFARMRDKYAPLIDDDLAHVERELEARKQWGWMTCHDFSLRRSPALAAPRCRSHSATRRRDQPTGSQRHTRAYPRHRDWSER